MELSKDSKLVRFAYLWERYDLYAIKQTTLCALFWRTVFTVLAVTVVTAIALGVLGVMVHAVWVAPLLVLAGCSIILAFVGTIAGLAWLVKTAKESERPALVLVRAVKARFCPIITLVD